MKKCYACKIEKPLEDFRKRGNSYHNTCKKCVNLELAEERRKKDNILKVENPEQFKWNRKVALIKSYGISVEHYLLLLEQQNGRCAICFKLPEKGRSKSLHIDHCHKTGKVRGLLCHGCNTGLGLLEDSETIISSALNYIKNNKD